VKVLNNLTNNHYIHIQTLLKGTDEFLIVSPFLTESFEASIHDIAQIGIKKIVLVTTLKDNNNDLFKKANSLHTFCTSCFENQVSYEIRIDNKLHGKIYIAIKKGLPTIGIITSANFTEKGLHHNHEWGIEIDDTIELQKIVKDIINVSSNPLSDEEIEEVIKCIDEYIKQNKIEHEPKPKLVISNLLQPKIVEATNSDVRYFIKPVGFSDEPFTPDRKLDRNIAELHFSKRKPASVRPGDILICYGVGSTKLLGYFEVLTEPAIVRAGSRWPWGVDAKNLCPDYSDEWFKYNNTISSIQASYSDNLPLTFVGGDSLGALNFGADKIQLDPAFAKHVISIIEKH
jgi:HKD family nuclease